MKDEIKIFFPPQIEVETIEGQKVQVGKISWGKELRIATELSAILERCPELIRTDFSKELSGEQLLRLATSLLKSAPEAATRISSILLDKEESWIQDHLDSSAMIDILVPFFLSKIEGFRKKAREWSEKIKAGSEES